MHDSVHVAVSPFHSLVPSQGSGGSCLCAPEGHADTPYQAGAVGQVVQLEASWQAWYVAGDCLSAAQIAQDINQPHVTVDKVQIGTASARVNRSCH